jgi:fumarate reductase subunit C
MHYCALILQKDLKMDEKAMAYEPGVTFNENCVRNILQIITIKVKLQHTRTCTHEKKKAANINGS